MRVGGPGPSATRSACRTRGEEGTVEEKKGQALAITNLGFSVVTGTAMWWSTMHITNRVLFAGMWALWGMSLGVGIFATIIAVARNAEARRIERARARRVERAQARQAQG